MNFVWLIAAVLLFCVAIYLFNMYRAHHANDFLATLIGVVLLIAVAGIIVWRGYAAWQDARSVYTEWQQPSLVQKEIDATSILGNFCDKQELFGEVKMVPYVEIGTQGEMEISLPPFLIGNGYSERLRQLLKDSMEVTKDGSPYKGFDVKVERIRVYLADYTLDQVYVRGEMIPPAPDPAAQPQYWGQMVDFQFPAGKDPEQETKRFLRTAQRQARNLLGTRGIPLPGNVTSSTLAPSAPGDDDEPTIDFVPVGGGGVEPPAPPAS